MPNRIFATPESEAIVLRQLKLLIAILILSNIGLGFFGIYVLRTVDNKYSKLIGQAVPSLNELQTLTAWSMDAMRATSPVVFQTPAAGTAETVRRSQELVDRDRDLRNRALQREWLGLKPDERGELRETGEAFSREALEVVSMLGAGRAAEASERREKTLRPLFDRYVASLTKTADVLEDDSLRTSNTLTAQTGNMSQMMLGLAGWPVMIVGLFFVVVILFVLGILLKVTVFRHAEA